MSIFLKFLILFFSFSLLIQDKLLVVDKLLEFKTDKFKKLGNCPKTPTTYKSFIPIPYDKN